MIPHLSAQDTDTLDAGITIDELLQALKQKKKRKPPGLDGIFPRILLRILARCRSFTARDVLYSCSERLL